MFFALLLVCLPSALSQDFPKIKFYKENEIKKMVYQLGQKKSNVKNQYKISDWKKEDTLIIKIEGPETILFKYTFHIEDIYCDYQTVEYSCDECSEKHIAEILSAKFCGWKKTNQNKFMSNYSTQTEMEIQSKDSSCKMIIYKYIDLPKKEYKRIYHSIKNKDEVN